MSIATVDRDIIETHILTRLDGATLTSVAAASPMLRVLCTEEKLWRDVCTSTWPSINDPRIRHVISTFPSGYRSFFSDSSTTTFHRPRTSPPRHVRTLPTSELISAVDIRYKNKIIYSKVEVTDTVADDFWSPPLCIDILRPKESSKVPLPMNFKSDNDNFLMELEESMSLSWILIDPTRKRSVNLSSQRPISVLRHHPHNDVQLLYITILPGYTRVGSADPVQCRILVTCGGEEGGEMHVSEVNMQVQDMDGENLNGEDSLVILQEAIESERIKQRDGREAYEEFLEKKKERNKRIIKSKYNMLNLVFTIIKIFIWVTLFCGVLLVRVSNSMILGVLASCTLPFSIYFLVCMSIIALYIHLYG